MPRLTVPRFECPYCGVATLTRVLETRERRRRRECLECGATFSTIEEVLPPRRRVPHHRPKLPQLSLPFHDCADTLS